MTVERTTAQDEPSEVRVEDLFEPDPHLRACPYRHYDKARAEPGLYFSKAADAYLVTRHADVIEVLNDTGRFSNKIPFGRVGIQREREAIRQLLDTDPSLADLIARLKPRRAPMLASADPPVHTRQKRLLRSLFSLKQIKAAEPLVRRLTTELIDAFAAGGSVEFVAAFAVPLPVQVIALLMGVEPGRQADFKYWSDCFMLATGAGGDPAAQIAAIRGQVALFDYFRAQVAGRRRAPRDDLVTQIVEARQEGDEPFSDDEAVAVLAQMLVAGNETTTGLLGSCALELARRPALADGLRAHPAVIPKFVEEVLRREAPAQANFRIVVADTTVGGIPVEAGAQLMLLHGAAGRDPAVFGSGEIEIGVVPSAPHTSFGMGEHFCLGAPLARLETRIALEALLERFDRWSLEPGSEPEYAPFVAARGLARLLLQMTTRAKAHRG